MWVITKERRNSDGETGFDTRRYRKIALGQVELDKCKNDLSTFIPKSMVLQSIIIVMTGRWS